MSVFEPTDDSYPPELVYGDWCLASNCKTRPEIEGWWAQDLPGDDDGERRVFYCLMHWNEYACATANFVRYL